MGFPQIVDLGQIRETKLPLTGVRGAPRIKISNNVRLTALRLDGTAPAMVKIQLTTSEAARANTVSRQDRAALCRASEYSRPLVARAMVPSTDRCKLSRDDYLAAPLSRAASTLGCASEYPPATTSRVLRPASLPKLALLEAAIGWANCKSSGSARISGTAVAGVAHPAGVH